MATRFRTSFTHVAGTEPATIVQARIVNIHLANWTVDVVTQFDRQRYFGIQVGAPYVHYAAGEGVYAFPEVGAVCTVCIPSDSTAPFVLAFVMPHELVTDAPGARANSTQAGTATDASFAGGRARPKPGDIVLRGRDGNFVILHRGGVLQIGATELAQRLYLPLGNLMMDLSERYAHHNAGGAILWGLQDGPQEDALETAYVHTFRVFANDEHADIRVAAGKVQRPMPDPDGGLALAEAEVGEAEPIILEVAVAPKGFETDSGELADAEVPKRSVFRFVFDRAGNTLLRCEGNFALRVTKKLSLQSSEEITVATEKSATIKAAEGLELDGGTHTHLKGGLVRIGAGTTAVARLGDMVKVPVAAIPVVITFASPPLPNTPALGILTVGAPGFPIPLIGSIVSANGRVLV